MAKTFKTRKKPIGRVDAKGKKGVQGKVTVFGLEYRHTSKYMPHQGKREMERRKAGAKR